MVDTEENPEHIYSEDDDVVVKRFEREQLKLVEFKQHIKADILSKLDVGVELLIEEMVDKAMNQFENDETKKCLFVSTTHDYPCGKCPNHLDAEEIISLPLIMRKVNDTFVDDVASVIATILKKTE
tara:strand:+ start:530 stop:907 length:378 start_codon:yes stop_codon:yes gene_type:complete